MCGTYLWRYFPNKRNEPFHDNVKYFVRPMECKLRYTTFKSMNLYGTDGLFWDNCVDLEIHEKPQIRLHGAVSYFNITNFAQFENIRFTGEDALAFTTELKNPEDF